MGKVSDASSLGQLFISRRARLNGVYLWLRKETDPASGTLTIEIYDPQSEFPPLVTRSYLLDQVRSGAFYITFPPLDNAPGQEFFITLRATGGNTRVLGANFDASPFGTAYQDSIPIAADLAFRLTYDYNVQAMLNDLITAISRGWLLIPLAITLLLPGWLLLEISGLRRKFDFGEQIGLSVGLSLAIIPLLLLWSTILGLSWSATKVWTATGVLSIAAVFRLVYIARKGDKALKAAFLRIKPTSLLLLLIFITSLWVRLAMTRDLAAPPWVDSVHHATITRLILENGRFPADFTPYININAYQYHSGFHSILAVFEWLSKLDLPSGMLLLGEMLNALSIFAAYLLTTTLVRHRVAGLAAALFTGLFTPMPAYLTSWGRYTQLAGMLILPVVVALSIEKMPGKKYLLAGTAAAGLFLVHYRVAAFAALLLAAYWLWQIRRSKRYNLQLIANVLRVVVISGGIAFLLAIPWAWPTLTRVFTPLITDTASSQAPWFSDFAWKFITAGMGQSVLTLAWPGLGWSLLRRPRLALTLIFWVVLMFLGANLGLGGGIFLNNTSVEIVLFLPISLLAGYLVAWAHTRLGGIPFRMARLSLQWGLVLSLGILSIFSASHLIPIINYNTLLYRANDRQAISWIAENVPQDATVLINPFLWGYGIYAGNDGGYWISPLAGRKTMPPPVLYSMSAERQEIVTICKTVSELAGNAAGLHDYLQSVGIRFVYVGARGGIISPARLLESGLFILRYAQAGTWVFETTTQP